MAPGRPRALSEDFVTRKGGKAEETRWGSGMSELSEETSSPDSIPASDGASSTSTTPRSGPMSGFAHLGARPPATKAAAAVRGVPAGAKRQGKGVKQLPPPLTEALLMQAMAELPDGTRRATETCYQCFQVPCNSFPCNALRSVRRKRAAARPHASQATRRS